jgi:hypothetical protein
MRATVRSFALGVVGGVLVLAPGCGTTINVLSRDAAADTTGTGDGANDDDDDDDDDDNDDDTAATPQNPS